MYNSENRLQTEYQNEQEQEYERQPIAYRGRNWHWWIYVVRDGRPVVLGFRNSQTDSENYLREFCAGEDGHVICLDTVDVHRASSKIKSKVLEESKSLDVATRRMVLNQSEQMKAKKQKRETEGNWLDT